jgi:hypothetical protein
MGGVVPPFGFGATSGSADELGHVSLGERIMIRGR